MSTSGFVNDWLDSVLHRTGSIQPYNGGIDIAGQLLNEWLDTSWEICLYTLSSRGYFIERDNL